MGVGSLPGKPRPAIIVRACPPHPHARAYPLFFFSFLTASRPVSAWLHHIGGTIPGKRPPSYFSRTTSSDLADPDDEELVDPTLIPATPNRENQSHLPSSANCKCRKRTEAPTYIPLSAAEGAPEDHSLRVLLRMAAARERDEVHSQTEVSRASARLYRMLFPLHFDLLSFSFSFHLSGDLCMTLFVGGEYGG